MLTQNTPNSQSNQNHTHASAALTETERKIQILQQFPHNRADKFAIQAPWNSKPQPGTFPDGIEAAIKAHATGQKVSFEYLRKDAATRIYEVPRLASYTPSRDGTTAWLAMDFDGGGHAHPLVDPLAEALRVMNSLKALGFRAHLEKSGGGRGWHLWVFFEQPVSAADARTLGLSVAPKDAPLTTGGFAAPDASKGIEVFPKAPRIAANGFGNCVYLPFAHGRKNGATSFYKVDETGGVKEEIPERLEFNSVEALQAFIAAAPQAEKSDAKHANQKQEKDVQESSAWRAWRSEAFSKLKIEDVYGDFLTGAQESDGWLECRDPSSPTGDRKASAGVATGSGDAERGTFHSFISGKSMSVFDFLVERRKAKDFSDACRLVAEMTGVPLPAIKKHGNSTEGGVLLNSSRPRADIHQDVEARLQAAPTLFAHGDTLTRIDGDEYLPITEKATLQKVFAREVGECYVRYADSEGKTKTEFKDLPEVFAQSAIKSVGLFRLKKVDHYAKFPLLDRSHEIIAPGYNPEERVYYGGKAIEVRNDVEVLQEIFYGFPWADDNCASYENALSLVVTQLIKRLLPGASPAGCIIGNQPSIGKTTLTHAYSLIFDGAPAAIVQFSEEEEMAKNIVTQVLRGSNFLTFDNLKEENVSSPTLEMFMTSPVINLRILGGNRSINRPNTIQTFLTLNEGNVCRDILTRSIPIRLHIEGDSAGWKWGEKSLEELILPRREIILGEILGMWRRWAEAGKPQSKKVHRFRRWARDVGGVMEVNGYNNFLGNAAEVDQERDPLFIGYGALTDAMQLGTTYKAAGLVGLCMNKGIWRDQIASDAEHGRAIKLGRLLERFHQRRISSVRHGCEVFVNAFADTATKSKTYQLIKAPKASAGSA